MLTLCCLCPGRRPKLFAIRHQVVIEAQGVCPYSPRDIHVASSSNLRISILILLVWGPVCESAKIRFSTCAEAAFRDGLETENFAEAFVVDTGLVVSRWSGERRPWS